MSDDRSNLGLATTEELLNELKARIDTDYSMGGGGLKYTTVYGRPVNPADEAHAIMSFIWEGPLSQVPSMAAGLVNTIRHDGVLELLRDGHIYEVRQGDRVTLTTKGLKITEAKDL
jgi:hypothetical protein